MHDPLAKSILDRHSSQKSHRGQWEYTWQEIRDLVRPNTSDFQRQERPGQVRSYFIYDGTAPLALNELASGLQSFLTNPSERWFEIGVDGQPELQDPDALMWLEEVSDVIYAEYSRESTNFDSSIAETYLDLGAFGTSVLNQEWDQERKGLLFRSVPLADCYIEENARGHVDVLFRRLQYTLRQCDQEFGRLPAKYANPGTKLDPAKKVDIVHAVFPRTDRMPGRARTRKPWGSYWILEEDGELLREGGYDSFPYHVPRWTKLSGEIYGRSPAITCLPDIKMLNRMEYTNIKAAQKSVDPPMLVPNDGFILPLKTAPGSVNYKEPGSDPWEYMEFRGQWPVALEITQQKREHIRQCFAADWLRMEKEKIEMTAYEVADRRDEKLRFLAPMLGRIQSELLGPMVERSYDILRVHGKLPPAPGSLSGASLKVDYISPAARAQLGMKAMSMGRYIQELLPVLQVEQGVVDIVDFDAWAQELAKLRGASRKIIRSPEEIENRRSERQAQEQMAQTLQSAEPASKAVLNLASAAEKGGI